MISELSRKLLGMRSILLSGICLFLTLSCSEASAQIYRIRIFNLTSRQEFTAPVIVIHSPRLKNFHPGKAASSGLAQLAEDGVTEAFASELRQNQRALFVTEGDISIAAGGSVNFITTASTGNERLSLVSMLATSNDAFIGLRAARLPDAKRRNRSYRVRVYDAGSEGNSESCQFVPGAPCSAHFARDTAGAEGTIQLHPGILGPAIVPTSQLDPDAHGWPKFAARVRVKLVG